MWPVIFVFAFVCAAAQDANDVKNLPKYDKRYDYLSVDAILENKRLVKNYVDCLINTKPCTPEGKALRRILPEALRTKCIRCTESQKQTALKMIRRLKTEYPEDWQKLASRWDPTGDFTRYFEEFLIKGQTNDIPNSNEIPGSSPTAAPPRVTPPPVTPPPTRWPATMPPAPSLPPLAPSSSSSASPLQPAGPTSPRPVILNRFGDDGTLMMNSPPPALPSVAPVRPSVAPVRPSIAPVRPSVAPVRPSSMRPVYTTRPTQMIWATAASDIIPTRFNLRPTKDFAPPYTTAITLIDQIGYKIIRTTELVTDILKNTVRAVMIGR